ncbi:MAG: O-antigen ligase family protein [Chitinophagaceae bacterium]
MTALMMVFGFLCGRAILSLGMFLFCLNAIWDTSPRKWFRDKYWLWGLAWTGLYLISWFWSEDIPYYLERIQVKLPFLLFPLAFGLLPALPEKHLKVFTYGLLVLMLGGCAYSLSFLFRNYEEVLRGYSYSKVLPTPAYKDHIRFSIFTAWTIFWYFFMYRKMLTKTGRAILIGAILFFSLYLHVLAVKSGLLVLYSFALLYFIYLLLKKRWRVAMAIALIAGTAFYVSLKKVPSFKAKFYYVVFSFNEYRAGNVASNVSDLGRLLSYDLGWKIFKEHPLAGVGAGDVRLEMKKKYEQYSPETRPEERIVPHNQFLEVALVGGILTLIPFFIWVIAPLKSIRKSRNGFYGLATWFALFASMQVEPMLEVQFGVFVYLFCLLWMIKHTETIPETSVV